VNWSILLLLAVPPLFAAVVFGVYKLATARHVGFWLLVVLWSGLIVACGVLATGLIVAGQEGQCAGFPRHFWQEWTAAAGIVGGGVLTLLTLVRNLFLALMRRNQPHARPPVVEPVARLQDSRPSAAGHLGGFVGWTAATIGFFIAWLWCVTRYPDRNGDEAVLGVVVAIGLLVMAVVADFVRSLLRRQPGEPRRWFFLTPFGQTFVGRLLTGGLLLAVCVSVTVLLSEAAGFDLNMLNVSPPANMLPSIRLVGMVVVFAAIGAGVATAQIRRMDRNGRVSRSAKRALATGVPVAVLLVGAAAVLVMVSERVPDLFPMLAALASVFMAFAAGIPLNHWAYPEWWAHRRRLLNPEQASGELPKVQPLTPQQRKVLFWIVAGCLAFGVFVLIDPPRGLRRPNDVLLALAVVACAGYGIWSGWKWAYRGQTPTPAPAPAAPPLGEFLKTVPPLEPWRRQAIFWIYLAVTAGAVLAVVEPLYTKMGVTLYSAPVYIFIAFAVLSMTLSVREWAFKKTPDVTPLPLPVAPLVLTPDPTPVGGNCPTCGGAIPAGSPHGLCPRCLMKGVMQSANATRPRNTRPIEPPLPAEVNEFFPHLEVLELVGAGGMGAVYKARQPNLDRVVALKIVQSPTGDDDPVFAERFAREARAMAKLDHPNIVTIHESGEAGGLPYMLMEYVDGITLREAMADKVLTTAEALAVIPQICDALDYAHRNGVVHRDIKPENILIDQTGRVKIADFGLAKLADASGISLTHTRQAMGTPHYMAPEQWEKPTAVDHRADIYALGVVLYELLTGELPLGRFDLPSAKGKGNARMDQVVLRALAKEPGQRYQHASDLKNELSRIGDYGAEAPRQKRGHYEYRSKTEFLGWPLVHVVRGRNPATGKLPVAKGWVAVSDFAAVGGIAVAGVSAVGGVAIAGVTSMGLIALGGVAVVGALAAGGGGIAVGGAVAVAGAIALGGVFAAAGAVTIGKFAIGGAAAFGQYTSGPSGTTPDFGKALGNFIRGLWSF
jgi:tRNA A-37 threonylcarbamoyl transferase component Bud32